MYYGRIILSVIMFGGCFVLNDEYRKMRGGSVKVSMQFSFISSLAGLVVLLFVNGFKLECTPFTLLMAIVAALNGFGFTFCSFKALGKINLSLYSLFSMLGGMVLPFLQGILFYGETITVAKVICFVLICAALLLTVEKGEKKQGTIYYIGIFVLNGMSGVLSKIYESSSYNKTPVSDYSVWSALMTVALALVVLFFLREKNGKKIPAPAYGWMAGYGVLNKVGNFLLLISLAHIDASVQYPMVTGGVMIVSTLLSYFTPKKPGRREYAALALSLVGIMMLVIF